MEVFIQWVFIKETTYGKDYPLNEHKNTVLFA